MVVVGFGIAGGCAAVEAAAAGASVLVLERAAVAGGTSAMAGGHFYLGGGTVVQRATGHRDTPDEMYAYLMAVTPEPEADKIRAYADGSAEHCDWLESLGFEFERSYYPEKAVIQPQTQGLMYTGNEKVWPFRDLAVPAPRGHKVPVPGDTQGAKLVIDLLVRRAEQLGVEVWYSTGATELVTDAGGVRGVRWRSYEKSGAVLARSTILAAGGFVMNTEMVAEHVPQLAEKPFVLGTTYDDGLGIRLGLSAGGQARHMDQAFITAPFYPPAQAADRHRGQPRRPAVRGRGQLPRPDVGVRPGSAGERGVPDRRQRAHGVPADAAGAVHRRVGERRGDGARARHPAGEPGRDAGGVQRRRGPGRGPGVP